MTQWTALFLINWVFVFSVAFVVGSVKTQPWKFVFDVWAGVTLTSIPVWCIYAILTSVEG